MKTKNISTITLIITGIAIVVFAVMLGFQSLIGLFLDFSFQHPLGALYMCLTIFAGFILLAPLSILVEAILKYKKRDNKITLFLFETIQFVIFFLFMHFMNAGLHIIEFQSANTEIVYFLLMYLFFFLFGAVDNVIKREDEEAAKENI
ncbi:hypothetical protein [Metabacillus malikii]|uniref:Membrane protein n=1 Tax=Metabacillus malikii TaxID=1504265 RepID=A0ABT9ZE43_9BACI|nr:hypothetical protein [Metabacillus malikii]MDQ0230091.1 putative membrane protein [Metabacillus malikii]